MRRQSEGCSSQQRGSLPNYLAWWRSREAFPASSASNTTSAVAGSKQQEPWSLCPGDEKAVSPAGGGDLGIENGGHASSSAALLYLKNWHFRSDHPEYQVPESSASLIPRSHSAHAA